MATELFHYEHNGKKFTLPRMDQIPFGVARKLRKESEEEQFYGMLEMVADKKALDIIDTMFPNDVKVLMDKWGAAAETDAGKS